MLVLPPVPSQLVLRRGYPRFARALRDVPVTFAAVRPLFQSEQLVESRISRREVREAGSKTPARLSSAPTPPQRLSCARKPKPRTASARNILASRGVEFAACFCTRVPSNLNTFRQVSYLHRSCGQRPAAFDTRRARIRSLHKQQPSAQHKKATCQPPSS